jgi:flagellar protein FliO/FliZ
MRILQIGLIGLIYQSQALAASEAGTVSSTGNILKMALGLVVVLAVMALLSWVVKRFLPNGMSQHSAIKMVGGVNVGSRERVVVLEVANRWLVVGVAQGQVSSIANLEIGSNEAADAIAQQNSSELTNKAAQPAFANPIVKPFSAWLKRSAQNIKSKSKEH